MTEVHLLLRDDSEYDPPVLVRAYRSHEAATAACEAAHRHLTSPDAPPHAGWAPVGFTVLVQSPGVVYQSSASPDWLTEAQSRDLYSAAWALYDARKAAYDWWLRANPIDPAAPKGSVFSVVTVEYFDA